MEEKNKMVRLTVDLPERLHTQLKIKAAKKRMSMRQIIMSALLISLNSPEYNVPEAENNP